MDGWGLRAETDNNAVAMARTPVVDRLWKAYPHTTLRTSGAAVGLPDGQMGNSEVGHLNIGAGRVVHQDIVRISKSIQSGEFFENQALLTAMNGVRAGGTLHLMGLLSSGGVHSSLNHVYALIEMAKRSNVERVAVHALMDGRDTSPTGGKAFLASLEEALAGTGIGLVATVVGRYFCMDRDKRWERIRKAYDAFTLGKGKRVADYSQAVQASYDSGVTDEFIEPVVVVDDRDEPVGRVSDGDAIVFFNFRADRARQITTAFTDKAFDGFARERFPSVTFVCMTQYDERFKLPVAFPPTRMPNILADAAAKAGRRGFRIAETEKYAHVTYFLNGGVESEYEGEERLLIPSPKVATYDMMPEMSAFEVAEALVRVLKEKRHDYVICNFANPDMVGHTGSIPAAIRAVETVDTCVGRVIDGLELPADVAIVTADHGNAEMMVDPETGGPHTAHTTNPVPCILVDKRYQGALIADGSLRDLAPTMCNYLDIPIPKEMTGRDLRADF
jgi:2,3-bisphosphoglycerate-independent phosphoglycerate mutase